MVNNILSLSLQKLFLPHNYFQNQECTVCINSLSSVNHQEISNLALFESVSSRRLILGQIWGSLKIWIPIFTKICTFSLAVNPGPLPFLSKDKSIFVFLNLLEKQYEEEEAECKAHPIEQGLELLYSAVYLCNDLSWNLF